MLISSVRCFFWSFCTICCASLTLCRNSFTLCSSASTCSASRFCSIRPKQEIGFRGKSTRETFTHRVSSGGTQLLSPLFPALAWLGNSYRPCDPCGFRAGLCPLGFGWMVVRLVRVICVPARARVSRVSRVCPGSPRCLFTGTCTVHEARLRTSPLPAVGGK